MARIKIISETDAQGLLREIYSKIANSRGGVANVMKIHSLLPQTMTDHYNLYKTLMFELHSTGITRKLLEMIAVIVSVTNNSPYCVSHHGEPLRRILNDDDLLNALQIKDWYYLKKMFESKIISVLLLAEKLTMSPQAVSNSEIIELQQTGYSDEQILQIVLVISYFNFVNRNVLAFGLELEPDFKKTCK